MEAAAAPQNSRNAPGDGRLKPGRQQGNITLVIEVIRYDVTPGEEPAFEDAFRRAGGLLENSSHCLGFSLLRATRERHRYLMQVFWDSPDGHLIGFRQSKDFREYQELLAPFSRMDDGEGHYRKTGVELTKKQLVRISGPPR